MSEDNAFIISGHHDEIVFTNCRWYNTVRRTWRERLLSWPWRPWVSEELRSSPMPGWIEVEAYPGRGDRP